MSEPFVHWHEGMFLRPHHFQVSDRAMRSHAGGLVNVLLSYGWGCRALEIDQDALANSRFSVRRLQGRLPDGTLVHVPEDGALSPLDLKPALENQAVVTVFLAVPVLRPGRANAAEEGFDPLKRYRLEPSDTEDENGNNDPEQVVVRRLNLQLLTSVRDTNGYDILPLAKVERSDRADGRPRLSTGYIPPLLSCDAWPELWSGILQAVYDRIGKKADVLATQVQNQGIGGSGLSTGDGLTIVQLRSLNEAFTMMHALAFTPGIHPWTAYLELCRVIGSIALFAPGHRPPSLPRYDHDDLGNTFYPLKRHIDDLLDRVLEPEYKERPFIGAGLRMQVQLEPAWVESSWQLYIAVQSALPADDLIRILTQPGILDMKVGSSERVDMVFRHGRAGLKFIPVNTPPRVLPASRGTVYFQLAADTTANEWPEVQKSLSLAVRINENRVVGNIQDQRDLTVQIQQDSITLRFNLFAVPIRSLAPGERIPAGGA